MRPLVGPGPRRERRRRNFQRLQQSNDALELALVEPAARVAGVLQSAVFVVTQQQRAEGAIGRARVGPPADDELLLVDDLDLPPVAGALAGVIHRVRLFGDEPFPSVVERVLKELARIAGDDVAQPQDRRACVAKHALQAGSPLIQGRRPKVLVAVSQDVERDQRNTSGSSCAVRLRQVYAVLQPLKARGFPFLVERDDLAVEHDRAAQFFREACQSGDEVGKLRGFLVAEPRPDPHRRAAARINFDERADAVVLGFVDQSSGLERRFFEGGQHRAHRPHVAAPLRRRHGLVAEAIVEPGLGGI